MPRRADISTALALAIACLGGCRAPHREAHEAPALAPCAERFAHQLAAGADSQRSASLRYAFEVRRDDPALIHDGIEGVRPQTIIGMSGPNDAALMAAEVERRMAPTAAPETVYLLGEPSWLVYAPSRIFSGAEARAHLTAMCALSARGLILRQASFVSQGRPS
jgi:hypothetical protein